MELISTPFRDWKNVVGSQRGTLNKHANSDIHKHALTQAEQFLAICNNEKLSIASQVSTAYNASIQRNRTILLSILDVITTLAVQGIPLRATGTRCSTEKMVILTTFLGERVDLILFLGIIWIAPQEMRVTCLRKFRMNLSLAWEMKFARV